MPQQTITDAATLGYLGNYHHRMKRGPITSNDAAGRLSGCRPATQPRRALRAAAAPGMWQQAAASPGRNAAGHKRSHDYRCDGAAGLSSTGKYKGKETPLKGKGIPPPERKEASFRLTKRFVDGRSHDHKWVSRRRPYYAIIGRQAQRCLHAAARLDLRNPGTRADATALRHPGRL